ncbi:hypothetical protein LTR86_000268 [Recurvomyces mirabilis]|nr:hypothetical protein LTR86_000268 [Recurvomyces mirabilis]
MPPAISDDESDDLDIPDMIPAKGKAKAVDPEPMEADDGDDDDEEEGDEDAYQVEKILKHDYAVDGTILYRIKWLGYDDKADLTWEPVDNLDTAPDALSTYHAKIGGPPEPQSSSKGSSKKSASAKAKGKRTASEALDALDSPLPTSTKRGRKSNGLTSTTSQQQQQQQQPQQQQHQQQQQQQQPPAEQKRTLPPGTWDDHVLAVSSIVEEETPMRAGGGGGGKAGQQQKKELIGLLEWRDQGPKTQHKMKVLRQKVPQRLLDYYEQHL